MRRKKREREGGGGRMQVLEPESYGIVSMASQLVFQWFSFSMDGWMDG